MSSSSLRDVIASLYQLEPEEFVGARSRAAAAMKADGDEVGSARLRKLAKPTIGAFWVNQIAHHWPADLEELLAVGEQLRAATLARNRIDLTRLDRSRRIKTDALMSLLWHHGEDQSAGGGRKPSQETLTRVLETLTAAVMDQDVAEQVRAGTLARTVVHEGFTLLDTDEEDVVDPTPGGPTVTLLPLRETSRDRHPSGAAKRAGQVAIQRATADLVDAENDLSAARDTVESLARMLEVLESELVSMTRDRDSTRTNVAAWKRKLREAERQARVARQRLEVLTKGDATD
ncbi:hypothetical protein C8046_00210 [Serinibacter arcticus]|uniref:Uncharacterized protein n=1 Tax=Serinibacter arcticus TaxID=1655435 RepID=A0A2U1ZQV8_9MICO|nr:hypothetical protein [Serinibacter arcticus]PWD49379.1 hypothetical protein C8046_00210 [Serinibacter arcticus]